MDGAEPAPAVPGSAAVPCGDPLPVLPASSSSPDFFSTQNRDYNDPVQLRQSP